VYVAGPAGFWHATCLVLFALELDRPTVASRDVGRPLPGHLRGRRMPADAAANPLTSVGRLTKRSDLIFALLLMAIISVLLLPIGPVLLTLLLTTNLSIAMLVLLVSVYTKEPLEFSTFPSLLLVTTLFRLALNVASTRLILLTGTGGAMIDAFGNFVVGGNLVVGLVIFTVLLIIQLVVVTKGAGRIAEVAARFTLDAMPGKQMAIDADLNAGLISESDARNRREKIAAEAEFYGSMDGASKFVKGDAIAGLIITIINLVAGIIIGMAMMDMDFNTATETFSILTVGDGLVSQIPSLLIAIGSGMLVTKARSENPIGVELPREFFVKPKAIGVASGVIAAIGLVPGMPTIPFWVIAGGLFLLYRQIRNYETEASEVTAKEKADEEELKQPEEKVEDLLSTDRIGVEIGYRLIPLVDHERGGRLLERITSLRKQMAREDGLLIPPIRIKDNLQLGPNAYRICIYGNQVTQGELMPERLLAIDGGSIAAPIQGMATHEPAFGLEAVWIEENRRAEAEGLGYAVTDPASVFITHLTQVLKSRASTILNREDIQTMLESLKRESPTLVKDVEENVKFGLVQKVLGHLLDEKVRISNLEKILEVVADQPQGDPVALAEQVRIHLGPALVTPLLSRDGQLSAIIFDPLTEQRLAQSFSGAQAGGQLGIAPQDANRLMDRISSLLQTAVASGAEPALLTTAPLRRPMRQIIARFHPELPVISYAEIGAAIPVDVVGTVSLQEDAEAPLEQPTE
jgi:flagellar biosynthesis protein FlhA